MKIGKTTWPWARIALFYPLSSILYLLLFISGGCNVIGWAADKASNGEQADAKYTLDKVPTVIVAENWRNPSGSAMDAEQVSRFVYEALRAHEVGPQIDPAAVLDLKSRRSDFRNLTVAQIGKLVGAEQIIYINMTDTSLMGADGSESLHGRATARVKVVDAETGEARWPVDAADGFPISIQTPMTLAHGEEGESEARQHLLQAAADRISRLFYKAPAED